MLTITETCPTVNPDLADDSRGCPYYGHLVTGRELSRIMAARRRAYGSRVGNPYAAAVDEAMDAAGRNELDAILAENDAVLDRQADEAATLDRLEGGYCL